MCMEDIRIGRASYGTEMQIPVGVANTPLVGPSPNRIGLTIFPVATNTIFVSSFDTAGGTVGMRINDQTGPLIMDFQQFGSFLRKGFLAAIPGGAATVTIVEVILDAK